VLVVEDEEAIRSLLRSLLEGELYRVILAQDGAEALGQYRQQRSQIQLVITDIMMPRVDGIALIRDLKALNPEVKILAISGVSTHAETAIAAGADDFLAKPYDVEVFLNRMAALLQS
jgi:CheY-like chemotaxis protein